MCSQLPYCVCDAEDPRHPKIEEFLPGVNPDADILLPLAERIEAKANFMIGEATLVDLPLVSETERKYIVTALRHLAGASNAKEAPL